MDAFFHSQFGNEDLLIWKDGEGMFQLIDPVSPVEAIPQINTSLDVPGYFSKTIFRSVAGNWLQVGDWLLYLGLFYSINSAVGKKPRMIRLHKRIPAVSTSNILEKSYYYVGVAPPKRAELLATEGGGILTSAEGLDFAFTFITNDEEWTSEVTLLSNNDAESVATKVLNSTGPLSNNRLIFKVYFPEDTDSFEPTGSAATSMRVGMYMRHKGTEADYSFVKYGVPGDNVTDTDENGRFIFMRLGFSQGNFPNSDTPGTNMDDIVNTEKKAVFSGRVIPPPSRHAVLYKQRVYYAPVSPSENDPKPFWALNHLQYTSELIAGNGIEANYVENFQIVGDEASGFTGLIEFLGQLIIFKQKETWVLSNDILSGAIIKLFNNLGCVNKFGGHGYLVVGSVLYFVDASGVYAWDGQTPPLKISESIKEDLDEIPRNVSDPTLDRYGYARLSHDPQYNLIYLTFPKYSENQEELPTFIFHVDEKGAWTKMKGQLVIPGENVTFHQISRILLAQSGNRYMLTETKFMKLGKLDQGSISTSASTIASWTGSILDGGEPARKKHWKFMRLASEALDGVTVRLVNQNKQIIHTLVANDGNNRVKIGRHLDVLGVRFDPNVVTSSYRIHNYEMDVHLRGRR